MKEISAKELKQMLDEGQALTLIDVREPYEAEICHIHGLLIPMGEILNRLHEIPNQGTVVFHCRSGGRSATVIQVLEEEHGYQNLINLKGGILAWSQEVDPALPTY